MLQCMHLCKVPRGYGADIANAIKLSTINIKPVTLWNFIQHHHFVCHKVYHISALTNIIKAMLSYTFQWHIYTTQCQSTVDSFSTHFSLWILPGNSENVLEVYLVDNTSYHTENTLDSYSFVHTHNAYAGSDCWSACRTDHMDTHECEQHCEVRLHAVDSIPYQSHLCL